MGLLAMRLGAMRLGSMGLLAGGHSRPRANPRGRAPRRIVPGTRCRPDAQLHFFLAATNDEFQRASFGPGPLNGRRQLLGALQLLAIRPQDLITTPHAAHLRRGAIRDLGDRQLPAFRKVECDADFETARLTGKPKWVHPRATRSAAAVTVAPEGIRPAIGQVLLGRRPLGLRLQSLGPRPGFLGFALRLFDALPKLLTDAGTLLADRLGIPSGRIVPLRPLLSRLRLGTLCVWARSSILLGRLATTDQIKDSTAHLGRHIGRFERFGDTA
jgi:hypothetical protein